MSSCRVRWVSSTILCAAAAASLLACGADADPAAIEQPDFTPAAEIAAPPEPGAAAAVSAGCWAINAQAGFTSEPTGDATSVETLQFAATPSASDVDVVVGLSLGAAATFTDIAAAVRLAPNGRIDVRDGDVYRADVPVSYVVDGRPVRILMIVDISSHTYSVFKLNDASPSGDVIQIARDYKFRTQRAGVTHLDHVNAIADGDHGGAAICNLTTKVLSNIAYSRSSNPIVEPFFTNDALLSDGVTTSRVDPDGRVVATVARSGTLATDTKSNAYIANVANGVLAIDSYDRNLVQRWSVSQPVGTDAVLRKMATDFLGDTLQVAIATSQGLVVWSFASDGTLLSQVPMGSDGLVAFHERDVYVATASSSAIHLTRMTRTGEVTWTRDFAGSAAVSQLIIHPLEKVVFGGELFSDMDFGGGPLPFIRTDNGPVNGFVVELSADGEHVFSKRTGTTHVQGIATGSNDIKVSSTLQTQFTYAYLQTYDDAGMLWATNTAFSEGGVAGTVKMTQSGRVWWNFQFQPMGFTKIPYMLVFKLF